MYRAGRALLLAIEGVICLLMAAPLGILGAMIGRDRGAGDDELERRSFSGGSYFYGEPYVEHDEPWPPCPSSIELAGT